MNKRICDIAECYNIIPEGSKHEECAVCRGRYSYWKRKSPADRMRYRRRLTKFTARMEAMIDRKIFILPKRRRA